MSDADHALLKEIPARIESLKAKLATRILGQEETVRQLLLAFVAGGHTLVIGVPGLAKTLMIRSLAELLDLDYARIQFTPDLMPSDITGTTIIAKDEQTGRREFRFRSGPIFTNLLLADEINRTPPKTQAALLEAMEEYQVTVGGRPHEVSRPFFVLATQNPIEQEGTYPLPVTQLDRFMFQINIDYPDPETEFDVIATTTASSEAIFEPVLSRSEVHELLALPSKVSIPDAIIERATALVRATRPESDAATSTGRELLQWGGGPRAVQAVLGAAQAAAVLAGRARVTDEDYEEVLLPALRHRVLLNYHAEAERMSADDIVMRIRREVGDAPPVTEHRTDQRPSVLKRMFRALTDPTPTIGRSRP